MYNKIFNMAFSTIFDKYVDLIKALLLYTIISIGVDYLTLQNILYVDGEVQVKSVFITFILAILVFLIYTMVAITTHRVLILGEESIPRWGLFTFSKREWKFILNWILIGVITFGLIFLGVFVGVPFGEKGGVFITLSIFILIFLILLSRVSLVFPAIAVDKEITLTQAWNYTKEYKLLVFVTVVVFPFLFAMIFGFVYGIAITFLSNLSGFNLFFLESVLNIFITVFTVSTLSATYKHILEEHPEYFIPQSEKDAIIRDSIIEETENGYRIKIDDRSEYSFLQLKDKLHLQFFDLGYEEIVVDKQDAWMIRNPKDENNPYITLTHNNNQFVIEGFKTPMIDFINQL